MAPYETLPYMMRGTLALIAVLEGFFFFYLFSKAMRHKRWGFTLLILLADVIIYYTEQFLAMIQVRTIYTYKSLRWQILVEHVAAIPWIYVISFLGIFLCLGCVCYGTLKRWERRSITMYSVKQAVDNLPIGIACYLPQGKIMLENKMFKNFCRQVYGRFQVRGDELLEHLEQGAVLPDCQVQKMDGQLLVILQAERAYTVTCKQFIHEKESLDMVAVSEVTEEYKKSQELQNIGSKIKKLNEQLLERNQSIVDLIAQEEVLRAKIKIHNDLGSLLLGIRQCLDGNQDEQQQLELVDRLKQNVGFLKEEASGEDIDEWNLMLNTAGKLGVKVDVTGKPPMDIAFRHVFACGLHECLTNTIRHAHGNMLRVEIAEEQRTIEIRFSNNGEPPRHEIQEKGGLKSLRTLVEEQGGEMQIQSTPVFQLHIKLKKEEPYVQCIDCG